MSNINSLAIFGGSPKFQELLHVGRPNIGDQNKFKKRLNDIFENKWLTNNGPYVQELEARIASFLNIKHCVAVCNGTIALEIAIKALELSGEVIIPSFTFIATAHALEWHGIKPVFCDIETAGYSLDPSLIEKHITANTSGIMGVHVFGRPCQIDTLTQIADKHCVKLLFDSAHAFGTTYQNQMIGQFGEAEVLSFHATKFFNTVEGGAIITNNDALAEKVRLMRNFGFAGHDNVISVGTNGKMNELSAAMGLTNLENIDDFIKVNERNYLEYCKCLDGIPGLKLIEYDKSENNNFQYVIIEIDSLITKINRDQIMDILFAENILARRYFYPGCHQMEPYCSSSDHWDLPETERITEQVLALPTGTNIDRNAIQKICDLIEFSLLNAEEIIKQFK